MEIDRLPLIGHEAFLQLAPIFSHGFPEKEHVGGIHVGVLIHHIGLGMVQEVPEVPPMRGHALNHNKDTGISRNCIDVTEAKVKFHRILLISVIL